jgi:hypothetical protein
LYRKKVAKKFGYSVIYKKLPKINNRPIGENSPNQVTLFSGSGIFSEAFHRNGAKVERIQDPWPEPDVPLARRELAAGFFQTNVTFYYYAGSRTPLPKRSDVGYTGTQFRLSQSFSSIVLLGYEITCCRLTAMQNLTA